jgi:hypothetical protein
MYLSILKFARSLKLPITLQKKQINSFFTQNCCFCNCDTDFDNTYRRVGLKIFKKGYVEDNCFPLCSLCYKTRAGLSKSQYLKVRNRIQGNDVDFVAISKRIKKTNLLRKCNYSKSFTCADRYDMIEKHNTCNYCHRKTHLTVDKIVPRVGYKKGNIQILCWLCNRMKSNIKEDVFLNHLLNPSWG